MAGAGAEEDRNVRNDHLINNYMKKTLKTFAIALLLTAATVTAARAATLYQSLSVDLTLTFQGPATTNSKTGVITEVKKSVSLTTPQFLAVLATNLGVTLNRGASLIKATTLADGINFTNVITNSTTLVANATFFESNVIYTTFVYSNNIPTNTPLYITNSTDMTPTGYTRILETNLTTNLVQGMGEPVILGTNVQYILNNGPGLNSNTFVPINNTNDDAGATANAGDDAWSILHNGPVTIDAQGHVYFGLPPLTNFFLAQRVTNDAGVFAGTITTNLHITGTFFGDYVNVTVGPPREAIGMPAPPQLNFSGRGNATAMTANIGSGKSAMPFSSWNGSFDVNGHGQLGATVTNNLDLNQSFYVYISNGVYYPFNGPYSTSINYYGTNPPAVISGYTNIATNYFTNYSAINPTNDLVFVSGTVKQTFLKLVQP